MDPQDLLTELTERHCEDTRSPQCLFLVVRPAGIERLSRYLISLFRKLPAPSRAGTRRKQMPTRADRIRVLLSGFWVRAVMHMSGR